MAGSVVAFPRCEGTTFRRVETKQDANRCPVRIITNSYCLAFADPHLPVYITLSRLLEYMCISEVGAENGGDNVDLEREDVRNNPKPEGQYCKQKTYMLLT